MLELMAGSNLNLTDSSVEVRIYRYLKNPSIQPDFAAYLLDETTAKVRGDADMVFYGQPENGNGSVKITQQHDPYSFVIQLNKIEASIGKIAICMSLDAAYNFSDIEYLKVELRSQNKIIATAKILGYGRLEAALIIGECYRRQGQWKFRLVAQGFNGGLKPLSEHFGVEISEDVNTPQHVVAPSSIPSSVNLSKITLDKKNSYIQLRKNHQGFGEIKVNLNWNRSISQEKSKHFLKKLFNIPQSVDLDLGCFCELKSGKKFIVQALGRRFGNFHQEPYIYLSTDDRTGQNQDGEWLHINGQYWQEIHRIVIFAFIYEGSANWAATDAVIHIDVPQQAPIVVHLDEAKALNMCGIVELKNQEGTIHIQRHMRYFNGHQELDHAFGFGLRWKTGYKT